MKVKPVKMETVRLLDLEVGETFTLNGMKYVKLAEDSVVNAVPVLSVHGIAKVDISCNLDKSVEQKVVGAYFNSVKKYVNGDFVEVVLPDTDVCRQYLSAFKSHIADCWYVDNSAKDEALCGDEFFFIDHLNNIRKGSPSNAITQQITTTLNVRILGYIEPFIEVLVSAQ